MKEYKEEFKPYYDSFMEDYKNILRIPSVLTEYNPNTSAPFGDEIKKCLDFMLKLGEENGFKAVNVDNHAGFLEYGEGEKVLLIMCHLDVVPVTEGWTYGPFNPTIVDGVMYARGSSDDKGPLMSAFYALKMLKDSEFKPNMRIRFFFGCDEETGSRGLHRYIEKYGECDYGFSPDANYPCIYAEKGISGILYSGNINDSRIVSFHSGTVSNVVPDKAEAVITLDLEKEFKEFLSENKLEGSKEGNKYTVFGKAAHGSIPEAGVNAATYLGTFLSKYIENDFTKFISEVLHLDYFASKLGVYTEDDEMGKISNNPSVYSLENGEFKIVTNFRYPKNYNYNEGFEVIKKTVSKYNVEAEVKGNSSFHYVPKYSHLVQALLKAYRDYTDDYSEPISIGGGTYARDFKNAVAFGAMFPGEVETMHMIDERQNIDNLVKSVFIYMEAIKNICD